MRALTIAAATAVLALAGCSDGAPQQQQEEAQESAALSPGLYEATWTVSELRSTDKTDPATKLTQGATGSTQACVQPGPTIDPALFAEGSDKCTPSNSYTRGGRISMQMDCRRPGDAGQVMQSVTGKSTAESFEGEVSTTTYLAGAGDYSMTRTFTGRRVGECPAQDAEKAS